MRNGHRELWTPEEDDQLRELIAAKASVTLICAKLKRSARRRSGCAPCSCKKEQGLLRHPKSQLHADSSVARNEFLSELVLHAAVVVSSRSPSSTSPSTHYALVDLLQPPLHLGLSEVPISRVEALNCCRRSQRSPR